MRELANADGIRRFMLTLGEAADEAGTCYHFDLVAQALAKLERAHSQDLADVAAMLERGLIDGAKTFASFEQIEPELFRFPAIDPASFRRRFENVLETPR